MLVHAYAAFRFLFEIATLISIGYWGFHLEELGTIRYILGIALPILVAIVWGVWGSPKAPKRLGSLGRFMLELAIYCLGTLCLCLSGFMVIGIAYAIIGLINCIVHQVWLPDV